MRLKPPVRREVVAGALTGALLIFCFPRPDLGLLAWIALVPALWVMARGNRSEGLRAGAASGLVFHAGNLYWISNVMVQYGGLGRATSLLVLLVLIGYLTIFFALFGALTAEACARCGREGVFAAPVLWVGFELFRNYPFGGFPWCLLGYSQVSALPVLQVASLTGIYGVSFLLVLVNALFAYAVSGAARKRLVLAALPIAAALGAVLVFGVRELRTPLPPPTVRVAAVQGSVLQEQKWAPDFAAEIFLRHMALSVQAADAGARLISWPESSTPFKFDESPVLANRMRAFARERRVHLFFGSDDYDYPDPTQRSDYKVYNGAKLIDPTGEITFRYHKIHLVPFGEYVPLQSVFFFARNLTQEVGGFSPGTRIDVGQVEGGQIGAFICYEAIYPDLVRRFALAGGGLFLQLTNDAWFGRSWAPYQHFSMAVARAVESRRYLLRSANTGISALVDPFGRVVARTELFDRDVLTGMASFRSDLTFYVRHGDLLARCCAVVTFVFGVYGAAAHRKRTGRAQKRT